MALMPKRVRWRKQQRGSIRGIATRGNTVAFGDWGIQSLEAAWLTAAQIEAARVAGTRRLGTVGKLFIRIFPHKPVTATPAETRMGTGKGEPSYWAAVVRPGTVLFEVGGVPADVAKLALNRISHKLPIRCKLLARRHEL
ncbi:MAG: 50S ribosomal protein L16 [Planctomycetota bacterium]|nr:50S ribosomal protein L16 [Planctomycetota bacterium]